MPAHAWQKAQRKGPTSHAWLRVLPRGAEGPDHGVGAGDAREDTRPWLPRRRSEGSAELPRTPAPYMPPRLPEARGCAGEDDGRAGGARGTGVGGSQGRRWAFEAWVRRRGWRFVDEGGAEMKT